MINDFCDEINITTEKSIFELNFYDTLVMFPIINIYGWLTAAALILEYVL